MITAKLIDVDRPTINGRVYPKAALEAALAHWEQHFKTKTMPIFKAPSDMPKMEDIVGYAENFRFEDGYLVADVGFIKGREKDVGEDGEVINIRPNGSGTFDENGVVQEGYRMVGLCVRRKSQPQGIGQTFPSPVVGAVIYEKK